MAITKINTPELFDLGSTNTALQLPTGTTAQRPTSPSTGQWRFNTDNNKVEYWDGGAWRQIDDEGIPPLALENFNTNTYVGNGATQTIDAKFNEAAAFNGSSSYIAIDDSTDLQLAGTDYSISFWFNANNVTHSGRLINKDDGTDFSGGYFVMLNTNATLTIGHNDGSNNQNWNPTNTFSANTWYHIVVTYSDSSNLRTFYINGSSAATIATNTNIAASTDKLFFGTFGASSPSGQYFNGKIDQVRIFNTSLTSSQVSDLYNNETTTTAGVLNFPTGAGCVAAYQLDGDASDVGGTYGGVATDIGFVGLQFQPDLVWIKNRDTSSVATIQDTINGAGYYLVPSGVNALSTLQTDVFSSFDSNGFTVGTSLATNGNGNDIVAWCWKAGGTAVSNTDGTITSSVSANQDAGFSIATWTGDNSASNIGHGLGGTPELMIIKNRTGTNSWVVGVPDVLGTGYLILNGTGAASTTNIFGQVPDDTKYYFNTAAGGNGYLSSGNYVGYFFRSIDGYSKVGSYTGNGSTSGPIVETGFEPAFLLIKRTDGANSWAILDNKRSSTNPRNKELYANLTDVESTFTAANFLTNGFQLINTANGYNANGGNYIYLAIAAEAQPAPVLADSFEPVIYTGNGGTQQIATDFKPDLIWIKQRTGSAANHLLFDSIRGAHKQLNSNTAFAETDRTSADKGVTSFDSNGFTVKDTSAGDYEINGPNGGTYSGDGTYVAWCWKAAGVSTINNEGSITSITNANPAAGFSIVKYTGNLTASTVGHGLSSAPELIILKRTDSTSNWFVYSSPTGNTKYLNLDSTSVATTFNVWNNTSPTSIAFSLAATGRRQRFRRFLHRLLLPLCYRV